ncbi:MAG: alanine racemase [Blastocatellia bacterium]|nr:alanine racemase [Blastocatellia bacterium]
MRLNNLQTPSLILEKARVQQNADLMHQRAQTLGVRLRPHIKTHKCVEIARLQTAGQFGGITVSTLAEAEAMLAGGFSDITYAVPVEPGKFRRVCELARRSDVFTVITDSREIPEALHRAAQEAGVRIRVQLEIDTGDNRCGLDWESAEIVELANLVNRFPSLEFGGILTHAGHTYTSAAGNERLRIAAEERDRMGEIAHRIRLSGVAVPTVSVGSTPGMMAIDHLEGVTEARPGNYIFFDAFQTDMGNCPAESCALTVLAAVIHQNGNAQKVVIDAGAIALSKDRGACAVRPDCGYGRVLDLEGNDLGLTVAAVSQEHGQIQVSNPELFEKLTVGTRVRILTNHSCLTAAQYDHYNVLESGQIVDQWKIHRGW